MAKSKLVLMAAVEAAEGPWINVNGQTGMDVTVRGLSHGDTMQIEYVKKDDDVKGVTSRGISVFVDGRTHIDTKDWLKYRATKMTEEGKTATFVEVFPDAAETTHR